MKTSPSTTAFSRHPQIASRCLTIFRLFSFNLKHTLLIHYLRRKMSPPQQSRTSAAKAYLERKQFSEGKSHHRTIRIITTTIGEYRTFAGRIDISKAGTGTGGKEVVKMQKGSKEKARFVKWGEAPACIVAMGRDSVEKWYWRVNRERHLQRKEEGDEESEDDESEPMDISGDDSASSTS
jgi:hypothetical protein